MTVEDYLFCLPASLTGAPAITVPVGDGAVQVIGHRWRDDVAVAVARVVEAAAGSARDETEADAR
jgi:Asp-tRNA(Asn)/Glu-tRNA(Gln) amidotransferase A subunit family amidase